MYSKYYLWKKQVSNDGGVTWQDVTPLETTPSGDPIATYATLEECQGIVPPTPTPQYRWTDSGWTCSGASGYDKYNLQVKEVSYDSGATWSAVTPTETQLGTLIEADSQDCGYVPPTPTPQYRWTDSGWTCSGASGYDKYNLQVKEVSYDSGTTWSAVTPTETQLGSLIEADSLDCGYVPPSYSAQYLTFIASDDITVTFTPQNSNVLSYSKDNGTTWTQGNTIAMNAGDEVMFKGTMTPSWDGIGTFSSDGSFEALGNPMSLLFGDNFSGQTSLNGKDNAFGRMFSGCTYLQSIGNLVLPATTLAESCYMGMFSGCTSLTTVPSDMLPATTLVNFCYSDMFNGCTALTAVPTDLLPALNLTENCYYHMFEGCTSLTTAPELPATTLAESCYMGMFSGCTSLTNVTSLLATTLARYCCEDMFNGCTSLTTLPSDFLPATTLADTCYDFMFEGCTSLTTAPELPATTLTEMCYYGMFQGCSSLNYIKCLATNISAASCTYDWVNGVAASGTFVKNASMTRWTTGTSGIPNGWTVQNA